jgi:Protein of unknown function (DUF3573)
MRYTKLLSTLMLAGLSLHVFADVDTDMVPATPQQQAQINSLTQQINQLQSQAQNSSTNTALSQKLGDYVMLDTDNPFGTLPDNYYPLQILLAKQNNGFTKPLVVGGYIEGDFQSWNGSLNIPSANYQKGTNFYLTTVELYALGNMGSWTSAFASFQPAVNNNATTTFDQAFLTFGNLSKNPLYFMVGESYLPFGTFAGNGPWSNSLTTNDFRVSSTNQLNLGYYQNGLQLNLAVANGASNTRNGGTYGQNLENFIYNLYYSKSYSNSFNYGAGASYMSDIRGLSSNVGSAYNSTITGGKNGAYDLNAAIGYKQVTLNAEFASTTSAATNNNGTSTGILSSWMTTLSYAPVLRGQVTTFSVGYSQSHNMANIPYTVSGKASNSPTTGIGQGFKNQWIAFIQRPLVTNVYLSPEFDYATTYNNQHSWTGTLDISAYF